VNLCRLIRGIRCLRLQALYCEDGGKRFLRNVAIYRVSQEEWARFREGIPYAKVCRYNPKHQCQKLNGYGDSEQIEVWSSVWSTHCTCQLTSLIEVCPWVWCLMTAHTSRKPCFLQGTLCCAVSHVTSVLAIHVYRIVAGTLSSTMTWSASFL
jgi:hypothetical protein